MKKQTTRRALISSALALLISVSMLIGTTFAWFTDSVTSGRNTIQSGNLDVVLEYWDGDSFEDVETTTKLFNDAALWEPGYTEVAYLKVSNAGSLALKYQLAVNVFGETLGKTKDGADIKLSDHLVFSVKEIDESIVGTYTRDTAIAAAGDVKGLTEYVGDTKPLEKKGDAHCVALIIYMPTTVGNEANHNGTDVPSIEMGVSLVATQYTYESDSFDELYDEGADYDGEISSLASLKGALAKSGTYKLVDDIDVTERVDIPVGATVTLDLNGKTLSSDSNIIIYSEGDLTIVGEGNIESEYSNYALRAQSGSMVIDSANIKGAFGAISIFNGADVTINGGNYMAEGINGMTSHTIYVSNSTLTVNGGTFDSGYSSEGIDTICGSNSTVTLNDGMFYASELGASFFLKGVVAKGGTYQYNPSAYVADGYKVEENADGTWTVSIPKASTSSELASVLTNGGLVEVDGKITVEDMNGGVKNEATVVGGTLSRDSGNGNPLTVYTTEKVTFKEVTFESVKGGAVLATRKDGSNIEVNDCVFTNFGLPSTGNVGVQVYAKDVTMTFNNCTFNNMPIVTSSSYAGNIKLVFNECKFSWTGANCPGMVQLANNVIADVDFNDCKYTYDAPLTSTRVNEFVSTPTSSPVGTTIDFNNFEMVGTAMDGKIWSIVSKGGVSTGNNLVVNATGTKTYTFNGATVDFDTYLFR